MKCLSKCSHLQCLSPAWTPPKPQLPLIPLTVPPLHSYCTFQSSAYAPPKITPLLLSLWGLFQVLGKLAFYISLSKMQSGREVLLAVVSECLAQSLASSTELIFMDYSWTGVLWVFTLAASLSVCLGTLWSGGAPGKGLPVRGCLAL